MNAILNDAGVITFAPQDEGVFVITPQHDVEEGVSTRRRRGAGVFVLASTPEDIVDTFEPEDTMSIDPSDRHVDRGSAEGTGEDRSEAMNSTAKAFAAIPTKDGSGFVLPAQSGVRRRGKENAWTDSARLPMQVCVCLCACACLFVFDAVCLFLALF
jgi:hypothetical protein